MRKAREVYHDVGPAYERVPVHRTFEIRHEHAFDASRKRCSPVACRGTHGVAGTCERSHQWATYEAACSGHKDDVMLLLHTKLPSAWTGLRGASSQEFGSHSMRRPVCGSDTFQ